MSQVPQSVGDVAYFGNVTQSGFCEVNLHQESWAEIVSEATALEKYCEVEDTKERWNAVYNVTDSGGWPHVVLIKEA